LPTDRPIFLYLHTIEPHDPYDPPAPFRARFAASVRTPGAGSDGQLTRLVLTADPVVPQLQSELVMLYDAEIAANDAAFGELLEMLRARGLYDSSLIVFCADHGEELGDHGSWRHGHSLHEELVDIPLVVKLPAASRTSGRRVAGLVQQADLFATILDVAGLGPARWREGRSVLDMVDGGRRPARAFFSLDLDVHRAVAVQD